MAKRVLCIILILIFGFNTSALATVIPSPEEETMTHLAVDLGDIDGDSIITLNDALMMLQYSVGKIDAFYFNSGVQHFNEFPFEADINGDGVVSSSDALYALKISLKKDNLDYTFLEHTEFSVHTYLLENELYVPPTIINTSVVPSLNISDDLRSELESYDYENNYLIVFSDLISSKTSPSVFQIVKNNSNALLRYKYTQTESTGQHLIVVSVSKTSGKLPKNIFVEQCYYFSEVKPMAYTHEFWEEDLPYLNGNRILKNTHDVEEFLIYMEENGCPNDVYEAYMQYRKKSSFFESNAIVVTFEYASHGMVDFKHEISDITVTGNVATLKLKAINPYVGETPPNERLSFMVKMADVPLDIIQNCDEFIFDHSS